MIINRVWAMPNRWTFGCIPINNLVRKYINDGAFCIDPFAGKESWAEHQNDISISYLDSHDWIKLFHKNSMNSALFDPPYSMEQVKQSYEMAGISSWQKRGNKNGGFPLIKDEIARILKPGGICISFGWNSGGLGIKRGFYIIEILLVAHGGNHHDTICTVERLGNPENACICGEINARHCPVHQE